MKYLMSAKYLCSVHTAWTVSFKSMLRNGREHKIKQDR